ncbi:hypothetical protein EEAAV_09450 [Rahnella aceris]
MKPPQNREEKLAFIVAAVLKVWVYFGEYKPIFLTAVFYWFTLNRDEPFLSSAKLKPATGGFL